VKKGPLFLCPNIGAITGILLTNCFDRVFSDDIVVVRVGVRVLVVARVGVVRVGVVRVVDVRVVDDVMYG
jgi:hypothetical protein